MADVNSAPEPTGTCCVEGCNNPAQESWFPDHCALREAGVQPEWKHICVQHDLQLNMFVTRMFFGDQYDKLLVEYALRRIGFEEAIARARAAGVQIVEV